MIRIPGQLAVKIIPGRFGDFRVGKLTCSIGEFVIKSGELDQYEEGKYDGEFNIVQIRSSMYTTNGRVVVEVRAFTDGWDLDNVDELSKDESRHVSPQEVDPAEEEAKTSVASPDVPAPESAPIQASTGDKATPAVEAPTPASSESSEPTSVTETHADADLFGAIWPLGELVKLDATVDRLKLRKQRDRLDKLGYEFRPLKQDWIRKAA
jgi:hypothetical protein